MAFDDGRRVVGRAERLTKERSILSLSMAWRRR